jgi:uncharacterized protein YlxW (UPF0749 family)
MPNKAPAFTAQRLLDYHDSGTSFSTGHWADAVRVLLAERDTLRAEQKAVLAVASEHEERARQAEKRERAALDSLAAARAELARARQDLQRRAASVVAL